MRMNKFPFFIASIATGIIICLLISIRETVIKDHRNPIRCNIDVENLVNLIESKQIQNLGEPRIRNEQMEIGRGRSNGTVQTSLYALNAGGGLGNILFEMIALRGISEIINRRPVINVIHHDLVNIIFRKIQPVFPDLVEEFEFKLIPPAFIHTYSANFGQCCKFDDPLKFIDSKAKHILLNGHYFQSFKYFWNLKSQVRSWLTPHRMTFVRAEMMLPENYRKHFIICTHVRRGDFIDDGVHKPSDPMFTKSATNFLVREYQKTHENVSVVVLGNDPLWAYSVFFDKTARSEYIMDKKIIDTPDEESPPYDAIMTPTLSPEVDLAFSRQFCDVFLITAPSSTFGWWSAFSAKETAVVYYRDIKETDEGVMREMNPRDFYPSTWIKLATGKHGNIQRA